MKIFKFIPIIGVVVSSVMLSALILMLLWNAFLVSAVGVTALTFGQAMLGWLFVYFITAMVLGAKWLAEFAQLGITMYLVKRQVKKAKGKQEGLMKHFKNFMGEIKDNE